jgi:hypothetical protein
MTEGRMDGTKITGVHGMNQSDFGRDRVLNAGAREKSANEESANSSGSKPRRMRSMILSATSAALT